MINLVDRGAINRSLDAAGALVVVWDDTVSPGGWWWRDADGCPHRGYVALVESECDVREGSE